MNLKAFFVAALQTALDESIATPDDILKHVTADVLSAHLPRPLWARLFTACLGAPRVDSQLVVETIGVPNLCEHVPGPIIWACLAEIAARSLGKPVEARPQPAKAMVAEDEPIVLRPKSVTTPPPPPQPSSGRNKPLTQPPPDVITKPANPPLAPLPKVGSSPIPKPAIASPAASGTSQSLADIVAELEEESRDDRPTTPPPNRGRVPTQQRFRQAQTGSGIGRLANNPRRPQADAKQPTAPLPSLGANARRGETQVEDESETETSVGADWRSALAVEDEQLVDWREETLTSAEELPDRKR